MTPVTVDRPMVVLVDDDCALTHALEFRLELEGYSVETFGDGESLLEAGYMPREGCLVLDYRLPGMDGLALLARLRGEGVDLPAVLITTHPHQVVCERALAAGAIVVEKPLLGDALLLALRRLCPLDSGSST